MVLADCPLLPPHSILATFSPVAFFCSRLSPFLYLNYVHTLPTSYLPNSASPADAEGSEALISVASHVTCQGKAVKVGGICWYFQHK